MHTFIGRLTVALLVGTWLLTNSASAAAAAQSSAAPAEPVYDFAPMTMFLAGGSPGHTPQLRLDMHMRLRSPEDSELMQQQLPRIMDAIRLYFFSLRSEDLRAPSAIDSVREDLIQRIDSAAGAEICEELLFTQFLLY